MSDKRFLVILSLAILLLISVPYILGFQAGNSSGQFGGFLINPVDGHSYLAKMQQGFRGEWEFRLPYTAEPGDGAFLFLFYLFLGHIGRLTQIPLIFVFHGARLLSALWLLFCIYRLLKSLFEKDKRAIKIGFALITFGSGLGWIAVLAGAFTSDFWVAEAYPFLSMYTNPHFSLGLAIMIYALLPENRDSIIANTISGILLAIIQPFGVVIISLVKLGQGAVKINEERIGVKLLLKQRWAWAIMAFCLSGGLILLYQFWTILSDPILSQWHLQNITVKPTAWDLIISLAPCLILACIGVRKAWKTGIGQTLILWGAVCLALVFIPWSLQRRFLTGIYLPISTLSVFGLMVLNERTPVKLRYWVILVFFLAIPTNLVVLISGINAISQRNPSIFIDANLAEGLQWIDTNAEQDALVLATETDGLYIPSQTGRRVIYGHPFETINAEKEELWLDEIFNEVQTDSSYFEMLDARGVDYVLLRDRNGINLGNWLEDHWQLAYQLNGVSIFGR